MDRCADGLTGVAEAPEESGPRWIVSPFPPADPLELRRGYRSIIAGHAARDPDHPAFLGEGVSVTYAALLERIDTLAGRIKAAPAPAGPAALLAPLGADYFAGLFACLEAGRPVVILEPAQPVLRQASILETAGAALVLHDGVLDAGSPVMRGRLGIVLGAPPEAHDVPDRALGVDDPALLFTTSGSTGAPKLVAHSQRSLRTKLWALAYNERTAPSDRFMILGSHANFGSMLCLLTNLLGGATVCVADLQAEGLGAAFALMRRLRVNAFWMVPSVFRMIARRPGAAEALAHARLLKFGGEPCTLADLRLARTLTPQDCIFLNSYGTTEGGAFTWLTSADRLPDLPAIPVGTADPGYAYALLDDEGLPVAEGEAGEITVTASGVALGYWTRGVIDRSRFPPDPDDPDRRIYRLGDLGRRAPGGDLLMLGRKDRVIKINGQSVSPVEIEAALNAMPGCSACAVVAFGPKGAERLAAFLVADPENRMPADPARWLSERLPSAMIPSRFENLDQLPLLPGGKVDAAALLGRIERATAPTAGAPPGDPLTAELADLWADILHLDAAPTNVDFVELGGDSLALIGLILEIETRYGRQLTVEHLDGAFTIERLAEQIRRGALEASAASPLFPIQTLGDRAPFFCVHAVGRHTNYMVPLAAHMGVSRPVFGLRPSADLEVNRSVTAMARLYADALTARRPEGPLLIGGFSLGGTIAYEMACQLQDAGREIALVVLMDTACPLWRPGWADAPSILRRTLANLPGWVRMQMRMLRPGRMRRRFRRFGRRLLGRGREADDVIDVDHFPADELPFVHAHFAAEAAYEPRPRRLPVAVLPAAVQGLRTLEPDLSRGWSRVAEVRRVIAIPGMHSEIVAGAGMPFLAAAVAAVLDGTGL